MSTNYEKLKKALAEIFQLDQADLDFGIYRIMNQKRGEIIRFLEKDLLPQVKQAFAAYKPADKSEIKLKLDTLTQQIKDAGLNPDESPKVQELKTQYNTATDFSALENEVFSHLANFFRRYYDKGDFISQRRYKEGVYAIPYEGEEVKLYWANHDQYYIKTSEYFRDYTFKLPSNRTVHFRIAEADTEKDNIKSANGNDRRFIICDKEPVEKTDTELIIKFEYKPDEAKRTQKDLNATALDIMMNWVEISDWTKELSILQPTEANPKRTLLEKHLNDYTARNTFDYFIHKDLGKFLRRELDFYIKNEIMHLDDIENESVPRIEQYVSLIKVIRLIAHKIIAFLAQIEDFQKKLWLKKKFVVETNYCITIDRVPEGLYPEIAANELQREEWVKLFAIDEITGDLAKTAYTEPLSVHFLKENPYLVIDTKFFGEKFKTNLLADFDNFDEQIDGLLIHSENFQVLNLLQERYRGRVKCVYIDPPYNTGKDGFVYKDQYKDASWLSMVFDRIITSKDLLEKSGILFSSIDQNEAANLRTILNDVFAGSNILGEIVWNNARDNNPTQIAIEHEYIFCAALTSIAREKAWKSAYSFQKDLLLNIYTEGKAQSLTPPQIQKNLREFIKHNVESLGELDRYKFVDDEGIYTGSESVHNPHPGGYDYEIFHPLTGKPMRKPVNGYRFPEKTMKEQFIDRDRLIYGPDEKRIVKIKLYLQDYQDSLRSVISIDGRLGPYTIRALFGEGESLYTNPKPIQLVQRLFGFINGNDWVALDYFGGSGTTGHATINLNREDGGNRKYILAEMGEYFNTVLKPRIQKVIYSKDWKDGKPVSRQGSSHMFKYIRLESYEDTLNNLELVRTKTQETLLAESKSFKESYMLSYMLDVESKDSLLNLSVFEDPFNYKLKIATGSVGETRTVAVDLVETFNYLIGLTVHHIDHIQGYRVVQGINPKGEKVLIIWRNVKEKSNEDLERFFRKQDYNPKDMEFAIIYVNGDNNLENIRREDETWKVRLIEEEFQRLMFSTEEA